MVGFRFIMPEPQLSIKLRYQGSDVDCGTMPVDDVILALKGFAGAYGKVADRLLPESTHELRVSSINSLTFRLA